MWRKRFRTGAGRGRGMFDLTDLIVGLVCVAAIAIVVSALIARNRK